MIRVMVTGVGSNVGQGIIAGVRAHDSNDWILGTDIAKVCAGYFMCDKGVQVPYANDSSFISKIIKLIKANKIEYVLIGVDAELLVYARYRQEIESATNCKILISDHAFIKKCSDKYLTSLLLKDLYLNYPLTLVNTDIKPIISLISFPVVAKPRIGHGSQGVIEIHSESELSSVMKRKATANYCFQKLIEGEEYTCGLLFDKEHRLSDSIIMKRELESGTTIKATVVENQEIQNVIDAFGSKIKAFGSINLQLRLSSNGPIIFEINPRFSGTTSFRIKAGYNDVGRLLDNLAFNKPITRSNPKKLHFFRYWETMVVEEEELQNANIERI